MYLRYFDCLQSKGVFQVSWCCNCSSSSIYVVIITEDRGRHCWSNYRSAFSNSLMLLVDLIYKIRMLK